MEIGEHIPVVSAMNQEGETVAVNEVGASGYLLVFFYPKAETPGCIKQVCSVRDSFVELTEKGVKAIGVSIDSVGAQKEFHENRQLPYPLLADESGALWKAFGVSLKESGRTERQAFLFKDGALVWLDLKASTDEQAADVLAIVDKA